MGGAEEASKVIPAEGRSQVSLPIPTSAFRSPTQKLIHKVPSPGEIMFPFESLVLIISAGPPETKRGVPRTETERDLS